MDNSKNKKNNLKKSKNSRNNKSNRKKNNHKRIINKDRKNNRKKIKSINDKKVLITSISTFFILFMIYESDGSISFKVNSAFVPSVYSYPFIYRMRLCAEAALTCPSAW